LTKSILVRVACQEAQQEVVGRLQQDLESATRWLAGDVRRALEEQRRAVMIGRLRSHHETLRSRIRGGASLESLARYYDREETSLCEILIFLSDTIQAAAAMVPGVDFEDFHRLVVQLSLATSLVFVGVTACETSSVAECRRVGAVGDVADRIYKAAAAPMGEAVYRAWEEHPDHARRLREECQSFFPILGFVPAPIEGGSAGDLPTATQASAQLMPTAEEVYAAELACADQEQESARTHLFRAVFADCHHAYEARLELLLDEARAKDGDKPGETAERVLGIMRAAMQGLGPSVRLLDLTIDAISVLLGLLEPGGEAVAGPLLAGLETLRMAVEASCQHMRSDPHAITGELGQGVMDLVHRLAAHAEESHDAALAALVHVSRVHPCTLDWQMGMTHASHPRTRAVRTQVAVRVAREVVQSMDSSGGPGPPSLDGLAESLSCLCKAIAAGDKGAVSSALLKPDAGTPSLWKSLGRVVASCTDSAVPEWGHWAAPLSPAHVLLVKLPSDTPGVRRAVETCLEVGVALAPLLALLADDITELSDAEQLAALSLMPLQPIFLWAPTAGPSPAASAFESLPLVGADPGADRLADVLCGMGEAWERLSLPLGSWSPSLNRGAWLLLAMRSSALGRGNTSKADMDRLLVTLFKLAFALRKGEGPRLDSAALASLLISTAGESHIRDALMEHLRADTSPRLFAAALYASSLLPPPDPAPVENPNASPPSRALLWRLALLAFTAFPGREGVGLAACLSLTNAGVLDLAGARLGAAGAQLLARVLPSCNPIHTLLLRGNNIGDAGMATLGRALASLRGLQGLDLGGNALTTVGAPLPALLDLESLHLGGNRLGDSGARALTRTLTACEAFDSALHTLELGNNGIGPLGAEALGGALPGLKRLQALRLTGNPLGVAGGRALAAGMASLAQLQGLDVGGCSLGPGGVQAIITAVLSGCPGLQDLCLSRNDLAMEGAQALAAALRAHGGGATSLSVLKLSGNRVGNVGAEALAEALPYCPTLRVLGLEVNHIDDTGAKALMAVLPRCPELQVVKMWGNDVSEESRDLSWNPVINLSGQGQGSGGWCFR
jgi:Ran GTPase-activating protein (RanGAP) involved in mRNA processing and transport